MCEAPLAGGLGADTLEGGAGDDLVFVGGLDQAFGGAGDDIFRLDVILPNPLTLFAIATSHFAVH